MQSRRFWAHQARASVAAGFVALLTMQAEGVAANPPPDGTSVEAFAVASTIPAEESMWAFLTLINFAESKEPGMGKQIIEKGIKLPASDADKLFRQIRAGTDDLRAYAVAATRRSCKAVPQGSAVSAQALQQVSRDVNQRRLAMIASVTGVLSAESTSILTRWVDNNIRAQISVTTADSTTGLVDGPSGSRLTEACGAALTELPPAAN